MGGRVPVISNGIECGWCWMLVFRGGSYSVKFGLVPNFANGAISSCSSAGSGLVVDLGARN